MKLRTVNNLVFTGMLLILCYQYVLLYRSVIDGSLSNFVVVALAFGLGLLLGRSTYLVLGGILAFVAISVGGLMLAVPYTQELYFWGAVALITVTPPTTYLMYLMNHQVLKRKALADTLTTLQRTKPDLDPITGTLNQHAFDRALKQEMKLVRAHGHAYRVTLTMVRIEFLESVVNFLGHERFNALLRTTADHLGTLLYTEDRLYYLGEGEFVILSPMLSRNNAPVMRAKVKANVDRVAQSFEVGEDALILRIGQRTYTTLEQETHGTVAHVLAQLTRDAETDIVKEYL